MTVSGTWLGHIRENTPPASMSLGAEVQSWLDHPKRERGAGGDDFSAHHPVDTHWVGSPHQAIVLSCADLTWLTYHLMKSCHFLPDLVYGVGSVTQGCCLFRCQLQAVASCFQVESLDYKLTAPTTFSSSDVEYCFN